MPYPVLPHIPYQWQNGPKKGTPLDEGHLEAAEQDLVNYTQQSLIDYDTYAHGQFSSSLPPSGGDDTAAINSAIASGTPLGKGTFLISGTINGIPMGQGAGYTVIRATAAGAKMQLGPAFGSASLQDTSVYGRFTFDGASVAGATSPLIQTNSVQTTFIGVSVLNSLGDGVAVAGQNNVWINLGSGGHLGCGVVLDAGAGGHVFLKPEIIMCSRYHIEIRQTVNSPSQAYSVPEENRFYGGICEHNSTSSSGGTSLGCVHQLAGAYNWFEGMNFDNESAVPLVYVEPNTVIGRAGDTNGRLYFRDCGFTGGTSAIAASSTTLGGDIAVFLEGDNFFSGQTGGTAIPWTNAIQVMNNGSFSLFGLTTVFYSGSGAAPAGISRTSNAYPETVRINPVMDVTNGIINQGTWSWTLDANAQGGGYTVNTSNVVNDAISFTETMSAGRWSIAILYRKGTAAGKIVVSLDGVALGAVVDTYAASASDNNLLQYTGVAIPVGGKHTLQIQVTDKNPISTGWWALIQFIHMRRTA